MPILPCLEKLHESGLSDYLKGKAQVHIDAGVPEKQAYINAARELQQSSLNEVKNIYSQIGLKGYEKGEVPKPEEDLSKYQPQPQQTEVVSNEGKSILEGDVDLKGNEKEEFMYPAKFTERKQVGDNVEFIDRNGNVMTGNYRGVNDKGEAIIDMPTTKDGKKFKTTTVIPIDKVTFPKFNVIGTGKGEVNTIEYAVENNLYQEAIKDGRITAQDAKTIIESAGLEVPKEIIDEANEQNKPTPLPVQNKVGEASGEGGKEVIPPAGGEPPSAAQGEGSRKLDDKGILNRLYNATGTPQAAKEGFKEKGLKYEVSSQEEAQNVAKSIVDEFGVDEAVLIAEANKFKGGVNSAVFAESLNRLYEQEGKATSPQDKLNVAKRFAEIGMRYDEFSREQGRDISQIGFFYKKSPLGIQMMENAKRAEDFQQWSKPKDKSWKEFFDEMVKEPEFDAIIKEQVREGMKQERAEARKSRIKKVDDFIDRAKDQFKGGAAYSTIIPPKVITAALEGIKQAYHAGEKVAKIIQDAIDYISTELKGASWDKDKFRKEWEEKLGGKEEKRPLTDEEVKKRILDKFRNKLKGLTDKQKEDVVRKSFQKIVESGGLDYQDFRKIISDVTGRGEMTDVEAAKLKELVTKLNSVEEAGKKAREDRTPQALKAFRQAEIQAGTASKELNDLLGGKPNIIKRVTSIMQLNTLGIPALINNPIYNVWNQTTLRFPIGLTNTLIDQGIAGVAKVGGIKYTTETNIFKTQGEFFKKLGFGLKESGQQFATGLNRMDYTQKEIHGQQIRPFKSIRDLWNFAIGKKPLTKAQIADKALQGTVGIPAEIVARVLNLGDKPQRFAAAGSQASAFAKALNLKDIDYDLFIEFTAEEAYRVYKSKGLSDTEAGKKADYIRDIVIKEGQRSTFQQDNMLNDVLNKVFGGEKSGAGSFVKAITISPYIKIPSNAYWSYYNLVNPEVAMLQSMIYGAKAIAKRNKGDNSSAKDLHEARYWFAHGAVGIAMRAVVTSMVAGGVFRSSNTGDDSKKEREGELFYEPQGTVNVTKLWAWIRGKDPSKIKGGLTVSNKWFGQFGSVGNTIASRHDSMTPQQREEQNDYWDMILGNLTESSLKELQQGIFSNSSSLLNALNSGGNGLNYWGVNTINMLTNIVHPAAVAQISKAQLPYYTKAKADSFAEEVKNAMLQRSSVLRSIAGQYPPSKIGIWGDRLDKHGSVFMRLFGFNYTDPDNFAQPIYEDAKKTNDIGFFPPAVVTKIGEQKLNAEQSTKLEQYVGQARKGYIAPFINDMANIEGFNVKYSQLNTEDKKYVLQYLYGLGKSDGEDKFTEEFPAFKEQEKQIDYLKDIQKEVFRLLQQYKK